MKYNKIVGTGGIGKGMLFHTDKKEILGRSESRLVELSSAKDYCKQQIVFYYITSLLKDIADIYPIGMVGNDAIGKEVIAEMKNQGMNVEYIKMSNDMPTTLSICLQYSDKETCNITTSNSASGQVTKEYIDKCLDKLQLDEKTIVCALPEVSEEARYQLLKYAKLKGSTTVLSLVVAEADKFESMGIYKYCDILSVNKEEAQAIAESNEDDDKILIRLLAARLLKLNKNIKILMTCGKDGAYSYQNSSVEKINSFSRKAVNTTGAGDAFIGGTIGGYALGLPFQKETDDESFGYTDIVSAPELGTLCASMAIEVEDSIATNVCPDSVKEYICDNHIRVSDEMNDVLCGKYI